MLRARVAVELIVKVRRLREERPHLVVVALVDGRRDRLLVEFDVRIIGMKGRIERRRRRDRHRKIGAHPRRSTRRCSCWPLRRARRSPRAAWAAPKAGHVAEPRPIRRARNRRCRNCRAASALCRTTTPAVRRWRARNARTARSRCRRARCAVRRTECASSPCSRRRAPRRPIPSSASTLVFSEENS